MNLFHVLTVDISAISLATRSVSSLFLCLGIHPSLSYVFRHTELEFRGGMLRNGQVICYYQFNCFNDRKTITNGLTVFQPMV